MTSTRRLTTQVWSAAPGLDRLTHVVALDDTLLDHFAAVAPAGAQRPLP
jgi:hypothetical protein